MSERALVRAPEGSASGARNAPLRRLPISTTDVLEGLPPGRTRALERSHGNGDLIRALEALGIAGPFRRVSPWELEDEKGRHLIHAGGYAALPFGESPPALIDFAVRYLQSTERVSFPLQSASDLRAALATNLVALLASVAPSHAGSRVLFSNSGTEAVEAALKLVRASRPKARWLLTFSGAYHGKTLGSLSVTPTDEYQRAFRPLIPGVRVLPYGDADALERELLTLGPDQVAAVMLEPVQGEGGVVRPPDGFLERVERIRREYGVFVVADEVQSGLGRTGHWFASVAGGLDPDIVTLAKPLSGGLVPVGATIARADLVETMLPGFSSRRHSSTFGGNGLAMAVGLKALETLVDGRFDERARTDGEAGLARLRSIADAHPALIRAVRGAGLLYAIELRNVLRPRFLGGRSQLGRLFASGLGVRALHRAGVHACLSITASGVVRLTPALDMPPNVQEEMWARVERFAERYPQAWRMAISAGPARLARLAALAAKSRDQVDVPGGPS